MTAAEAAQAKWVDKINKLLAKAERASTEAEAQTFRDKAQQLTADWGVSDAMLESARGLSTDEIKSRTLKAYGIFGESHMRLNYFIGVRGFGFKGFVSKDGWTSDQVGKVMGTTTWVGWESDLQRAELLLTSLHVQLANALAEFTENWKHEYRRMPKHELYKSRRTFIESFGQTVANRLAEQRRQATKDYDEHHTTVAAAATPSDEPLGAPTPSAELVLVNRDRKLNEYFDTKYGKLNKGRSSRRGSGIGGAAAGAAAGRQANLGGKAVGSRKSIGS